MAFVDIYMHWYLFTNLLIADCTIVRANTQEDGPASSPNTIIKNKVSRAPRTGSVSALDLSNIQPSSGTFPGW